MDPSGERLRAVDAAWWRMDQPTNPMVIAALLTFDDAPRFEAIEALVRDRLVPLPRFRRRIVDRRIGAPRWVEDVDFDLGRHLRRAALPPPGDERALDALIGELGSAPLDRDHPLWQLHWIERGRGAALLVRIHHCVGDGVALIRLLLGVSEHAPGAAPADVGVTPPAPRGLGEAARDVGRQARALARMLALPSDPSSALRGELGAPKRFVQSRPIPLAEIKGIGRPVHASVNDVLVAALTGALRRYLLRNGGLPAKDVRAMVPVYLRGRDAPGDLGNHFGLVYLDLPVRLDDPAQRLREGQARMTTLKGAPDAVVALEVLGALGLAWRPLEDVAIDLFTRKASVMFTNVAGPPDEVHLAGRPVSSLAVWAPVSGHLGVGISAISYAGAVRIGVRADPRRIPNPRALLAVFDAELDALRGAPPRRDVPGWRGTMGPWPGSPSAR